MKTEASFGIIPVIKKNDAIHYLLIKHHAGHWGFPKGHAEPGESARQSACREFEEETGINDYTILGSQSFEETYEIIKKGRDIVKTVTYFPALCNQKNVIIQTEEIADYLWLNYQNCEKQITCGRIEIK